MANEVELKLIFALENREKLEEAALFAHCAATERPLEATYYDTSRRDLHKAGVSLRVRREGDRYVQTVKGDGGGGAGLFDRPEWERTVGGEAPQFDPLDRGEGNLLNDLAGTAILAGVEPVFRTEVMRERRILDWQDAQIEVAIDRGEAIAGGRREPICELELELLSGKPHALFAAARSLDAAAPLRLSVLPKSERGYRLAEGKTEKAVKADPADLSGASNAAEAFVTIAMECLRQFRLNEDLFRESGSPDSLHQMRVGIRRLRSASSLFRPILREDARYEPLNRALRALAGVLGEVRDLDVLIPWVDPARRAALLTAREDAREKVVMTLDLAQTRHLLLDLAEWLALGEWREGFARTKWAHVTITEYAAHMLEKRFARLRRVAAHWQRLDAEHRHHVRKEAKKLRYATEFFASLFDHGKKGVRLAVFLDALEQVQDDLGALNDMAVAPSLLARFDLADAVHLPSEKKMHGMIDKAGKRLAALFDTEPFWD